MQQEHVTLQRPQSRPSRPLKRAVLATLKLSSVFALARSYHRRHIRILCYHGAWIAEGAPAVVVRDPAVLSSYLGAEAL